MKLELTVADSARLHGMLLNNDLHLAIALMSPELPETNKVFQEQLFWAASEDCPLGDPVPLILFPEPCPFREFAFEALKAAGRRWSEQITTTSVAAAQVAVASGAGVCCLPAGALLGGFKILKEAAGFPPLPATRLAIYTQPQSDSAIVDHLEIYLADFLENAIGQHSALAKRAQPDLRLV